jgi:hypothetical protein
MNAARFSPGAQAASILATVSTSKRINVAMVSAALPPSGGRPIRPGLSDNFFCAKSAMFPLSPIAWLSVTAYIGVIGY